MRHGSELSTSTLCPTLQSLEEEDLLASGKRVVEGKMREYYQLKEAGGQALAQGREKAIELLTEIESENDATRLTNQGADRP